MTDAQSAQTALDKLIEAVEAGTSDRQDLLHMIDNAMPQDNRGCMAMAHQAYHGSLDAALALHEALLPGRPCSVTIGGEYGASAHYAPTWETLSLTCSAQTPARAWLIAILRAYRSTQK